MIFIGDIHGRLNYYLQLIQNITHTPTVQVGDMGLGFPGYQNIVWTGDHFFIRGNHDDPEVCRAHPKHLGDFGYDEKLKLFYIGGAASVDKEYRTLGIDWWPDEEITYATFVADVIPLWEKVKPRVVVSHDCPDTIKTRLLNDDELHKYSGWPDVTTLTERALQTMFEIWQPDVWVFGHYHRQWTTRADGTKFVCVNTCGTFETEE